MTSCGFAAKVLSSHQIFQLKWFWGRRKSELIQHIRFFRTFLDKMKYVRVVETSWMNKLDKLGVSPSVKPPTSLPRWKQRLMASTKLATSIPPPPSGWRRGSLNNTLLAVQSSLHRDKPGGGISSADGIQTPFMRDMLRTDLRRAYLGSPKIYFWK